MDKLTDIEFNTLINSYSNLEIKELPEVINNYHKDGVFIPEIRTQNTEYSYRGLLLCVKVSYIDTGKETYIYNLPEKYKVSVINGRLDVEEYQRDNLKGLKSLFTDDLRSDDNYAEVFQKIDELEAKLNKGTNDGKN